MERIEPVRRPAAPVRRRPKLTPVSVCQAIHDAPYGLARLVRRGVGAVGYWLAWTWDAVVTDQKQMYHDFLRSRFVTRWRAFFRSPTLTGFTAALRSNWLVRLTAMAALTAAIFVGVSLDPSVPTLDAICILVDSSGPHVVSQDTEELDTGYLSLRRSLGGSHDMQYLLPAGQSINVTHNSQTITAVSQAERLPAFLDRCNIQLGSDEMVELNLTGDELSIRISGTLTYQHFVTVETDYEIKRTPDPLMDQGTEEIIRKGVAGQIVETYEDTVVRGEVVSTRYVGASHDTSHAELIRYGTRVYEVDRDDTIEKVVPYDSGEGGILYFKSGVTMTYSKVMTCIPPPITAAATAAQPGPPPWAPRWASAPLPWTPPSSPTTPRCSSRPPTAAASTAWAPRWTAAAPSRATSWTCGSPPSRTAAAGAAATSPCIFWTASPPEVYEKIPCGVPQGFFHVSMTAFSRRGQSPSSRWAAA